ncbi:MAG: hypothetical protein RLY93_14060 [Sumerlaeia bacterium]
MSNKRFVLPTLLAAGGLALAASFLPANASAVTLAADDASTSTYDSGFDPGMNGGFGLEAWEINSSGANAGRFKGDSSSNGFGDSNGDGDINTTDTMSMGVAWGLWANSGDSSEAIRPFSTPLSVGDTLTFGMDNGFIDGGSAVGFSLRNASDENVFEALYAGGAPAYQYFDAEGFKDTTIGFTSDGLNVSFSLTSSNSYDFSLEVVSSGDTYTTSGLLAAPSGGQAITEVRFFNNNAGSGATNDAYFNSILIDGPGSTRVESWETYE